MLHLSFRTFAHVLLSSRDFLDQTRQRFLRLFFLSLVVPSGARVQGGNGILELSSEMVKLTGSVVEEEYNSRHHSIVDAHLCQIQTNRRPTDESALNSLLIYCVVGVE